MANDLLNPPNLFNPMMLWTDMGMRALEMTLSSSQNVSEGLDRLTRAGASTDVAEIPEVPHVPVEEMARPAWAAGSAGLQLAAQMQRTTFELMTQGWQQWMNAFGTLFSMGAGRSFGETVARQTPLLNVMREGLQWSTDQAAGSRPRAGGASRQQGGRQRESQGESREHASARADTKRRTRGAARTAKPKSRSRSS